MAAAYRRRPYGSGKTPPPSSCNYRPKSLSKSPQSIVDVKEGSCSPFVQHGQQHSRTAMMSEQGKDGDSSLVKSPESGMDEKDEPHSANVKHDQRYQSGTHRHKKSPQNMMRGKEGQDGHSGFLGRQTPPANCSAVASTGFPQSITDEKNERCSADTKHGQQYKSVRHQHRKSPQKRMMGKQDHDGHSGFLGRETPLANCSPVASDGKSPQSGMDEKDEPRSANVRHGQCYQSGTHWHKKSPQNMMTGKEGRDGHSGFIGRQTPPANRSPVASTGSPQSPTDEKDEPCSADTKCGQQYKSVSHQHRKLLQNMMMGKQDQDGHSGFLGRETPPANCSPAASDGTFDPEISADEVTEVDSTNRKMVSQICDTHRGGQQHVQGSGNEIGIGGTKLEYDNYIKPFDICWKSSTTGAVKLSPSLLTKNREKRREAERNKLGLQRHKLRSGMILLEAYLSLNEQVEIINECHKLGLGPGGFYQPGYSGGAKLHLHMMCLGKDWNPETSAYGYRRATDDAMPPSIPDRFKVLVDRALKDSQNFINQRDVLPSMKPDVCIVNFYTNTGKLGLHQDKDESKESLDAGLPVVSFSIGDTAEFLYGDERDVEKAEKVMLKSGDVLIFGGKSRHVFHGVPSIAPDSAPRFIIDETGLRPGRLNLTFRQY